jgi:hypothetical protein
MTAVWDNYIGPLQISNRFNPDFAVEIYYKKKMLQRQAFA